MPVILSREFETLWLDPSVTDPARVLPLLQPYPADAMEAYAVSPRVGSAANDDAALLEPVRPLPHHADIVLGPVEWGGWA